MVSPYDQPASKARRLAFMISGFLPNLAFKNSAVPSVGRWYSQQSRPRANIFFARSASFLEISNSFRASTVIEVSAIGCTLN